jgi:hypothetical protein
VTGRDKVIARAIDVDTVRGGALLVISTALLSRFHRQHRWPKFWVRPRLPWRGRARTAGRVAAVEAVFWTEDVAGRRRLRRPSMRVRASRGAQGGGWKPTPR